MSLVNDHRTRALWEDAQRYPEWAATRFWEYVFRTQFFVGPDWAVSSQQPPTRMPRDLRRMDTFIEKWKNGKWNGNLCHEAKKINCTQSEIDEVEKQAYDAAINFLNYNKQAEMYTFTTIGTSARIWYLRVIDDYLTPLEPNDPTMCDRRTYIEAYSSDAKMLRDGFNYVLMNDKLEPSKLQILRSNWPSPSEFVDKDLSRTATSSFTARPSVLPGQLPYRLTAAANAFTGETTQASGTDTVMEDIEKIEESDNEESEGESEEGNRLSSDAVYVDVTRKVITHLLSKNETLYCFNGRETLKRHWKKKIATWENEDRYCVAYKTKHHEYWTWELPKDKGKGKAK